MTAGIFFWVELATCGGVMISIFQSEIDQHSVSIIELSLHTHTRPPHVEDDAAT